MKNFVSKIKEKAVAVKSKVKGAAMALAVVAAVGAASLGGGVQAHASATPAPGIDFSGQSNGIDVMGAISSAFSFLGMFNAWVYLVLGIVLAPVMIGMIFWLVGKLKKRGATA